MLSALMMLRRVLPALRYATREEIFGAGLLLVVIRTLSYTLGQDWNVVDSLYFSVSTLTTTSVSDPGLVLDDGWLKIFTVIYQLIGIGILVEVLRRLGIAFITVRAQERPRGRPRARANPPGGARGSGSRPARRETPPPAGSTRSPSSSDRRGQSAVSRVRLRH